MSNQFKLPCPSCSTIHIVSQSQAGETLACDCGQIVLVPTLRELRDLERAEDATSDKTPPDWNVQRGLLFVGGIILIATRAL